jgi:hypothetical protein
LKNLLVVLFIIVIVSVIVLGCSKSEPQPELQQDTIEYASSGSAIDEAGKAMQSLDAFLRSVTTTTTAPVQRKIETVQASIEASEHIWDTMAYCETGGNWSTNTGNGYGGGLQFAHTGSWSTWRSYGGTEFTEHPWEASREQQIVIAERVLQSSGWKAWPGCARKNGLL